MADLYTQEFPDNIRTISGLVNLIKQDDVTLECNTLLGAVGVQLLGIPANYWSTQWKLYIVDKGNNASINNITITAPPGVLINGAPTFTINSNGASLLVRITSNTNFVGQYSVIGGGAVTNGANVGTGVGQIFKNLVATILNFKTIKAGVGVTITNNADDVTIDSSAPILYLYAKKNLNDGAVTYAGINIAPTFSIISGTQLNAWDSKVEDGVTGFDLATGRWTVPVTGKYAISAKLITRLLSADVNAVVDGGGQGWQSLVNAGYLAIGVIRDINASGFPDIVCANKETTLVGLVSDINLSCATLIIDLTIGDIVHLNVLNKTQHEVIGIPDAAGQPQCYADLSIVRVHP